jgi:hypothetical protein
VAHGAVNMNIEIGRDQHGFGKPIGGIVARRVLAAKDGSDVPVVDGDPRILYDLVPAQEPPRSNCAGHPRSTSRERI